MPDFVKGAQGPANPYDVSPAALGTTPAYLAGSGSSVSGGSTHDLDYATLTATGSTVTATTEGTSVAVITGNAVNYSGSAVYVEFFLPNFSCSGANVVTFVVYQDAAIVGHIVRNGLSSVNNGSVFLRVQDTPAQGSHTYKVAVYVSASNFIALAGGGGSGNLSPGFLRVVSA